VATFVGIAWLGAARSQAVEPKRSEEPPPVAGMSEDERDRIAESIARSIMSPFCPGRTVSGCPNAGPWREDIRRWVGEGVDADEIKRRLHERVPQHDLAGIPKNRLGWVLPVGAGLGFLGFLVFLLRYLVAPRRGAGGASEAKDPDVSLNGPAPKAGDKSRPAVKDDLDSRLEEELDTLEN
jgi:hypothetical protein